MSKKADELETELAGVIDKTVASMTKKIHTLILRREKKLIKELSASHRQQRKTTKKSHRNSNYRSSHSSESSD